MGANSLCSICRTMDLNLPGPAALFGFKPKSRLPMPSAAMLMSDSLDGGWAGMVGCYQSHVDLAMPSGKGTLN